MKMIVTRLLLVLIGLDAAQSGIVFTLFTDEVDWYTAKSNCEARGQKLAVLDTDEKRTALQAQNVLRVEIPCNCIGFRDTHDNDTYVWLNGKILADSDPFWMPGWPGQGNTNCGCLLQNKIYDDSCDREHPYICERDVIKAQTYNLASRDKQITGDHVVSVKVRTKVECGVECLNRNCKGFSYLHGSPGGGTCRLTMTGSVTHEPLEGAEYYTTD